MKKEKYLQCVRCGRYYRSKGLAAHLRLCSAIIGTAGAANGNVQQVVTLQDQRSSMLWYLLNPAVVIWVCFLAWVACQIVEDGIANYVAGPLIRYGMRGGDYLVAQYEEAQKETQAARREQKLKAAESYLSTGSAVFKENFEKYQNWLNKPNE